MRLAVRHETAFTYDGEVQVSYNELRLLPRDLPDQRLVAASLEIRPDGRRWTFSDYFGNAVTHVEVRQAHRRLSIVADVVVETGAGPSGRRDGSRSPDEFLVPGALTRPDEETRRLLLDLPADGPRALLDAVHGLLRYRPGVTDTLTDVNLALRQGEGVCQDFAHVAVTACRLRGLPARYAGGYLLQDGPRAPHSSHAWVEVFHDGAWHGYDPTNGIRVDERFLRVTVGRDYADVPPVKGVYLGAARGRMTVRLRVLAEEAAAQQ